jgi:hypothetical protein
MRIVRGKFVNAMMHTHCLPIGWEWWKIEVAQDIQAYHSIEAEDELTQLLIDQVKLSKN